MKSEHCPDSGHCLRNRVTLINESGLYALILSSKLPQAKAYSIAFPKSTPLNVNKKKKFPKKQ